MGEPTSMTKRARAFSATFFNRDRTTSSNSSPGPASPTKPLGAESFPSNSTSHSTPPNDSPAPIARRTSRSGQPRPSSVINPFAMSSGIGGNGIQEADILPEMVGVFKYLGEHAQKVYHEGYFQKLNDMNPDGTAVTSREWTDCYAQLIGTVLTIWDDRAIQEEEERARRGIPPEGGAVKPTFLNLTDASMKMIDSLPQRAGGTPLQNVLSLSTAGRNRYLLHFASVPELTQWTAAIRLAMFEHNCLQEAYTGALIAAKGRSLNSIGTILERSKFKIEDWTRVRFGAGTPWKRYWAVITPPDEKSFQKAKKVARKASKQAGAQIQMEVIIGDIKFYENSKVKKKTIPVATISGAFAAYAVYPEAKALIDQSTLVKIEGNIVIHSDPPFTSEGIVFMMPDHHAAVTGFEMMLRFLIPTYDVFNLYGRPNRLAADSIDPRSLMFAFPREPRQPYRLLDLADVVGVINENGSSGWSEAEWRRKLKQTTSKVQLSGRLQRASLASPSTASLPGQMKIGSAVSFDGNTGRSSFNTQRPGLPTIQSYGQQNGEMEGHSAPPQLSRQTSHTRSMSEAQAQFYPPQQSGYPDAPQAPPPPPPGQAYGNPPAGYISPQNTGYQQPQGSAAPLPQSYTNGYSGPNSRPPSSRSQRSQMSGRSGHGQSPPNQQMGYRQPGPPGGPPSAFRGDPRGPGGFDPNLGNRQPPQLQTANLANTYPMPTASPSTSRGPPVPAHSFSPVANARAMSRLSVGTLEMMHGNNAGPIPVDYHAQAQSPTLGFPAQADGATAQRARSYGSTDTSTDSELSSDSDLAAPRPAYTTQGHRTNGSTASITPATGAIASRIPKSNDLHTDPNDFDLSDELRRKQLETAAAAATRNGGHHAPYGQHPLPPLPPNADQQGYQQGYGGNYANGYDGSAQSNIVHSPVSLLSSSPPLPHLHLKPDTSSSSFTSATAAAASTTTTTLYGITNQKSPRTDGTGEISATTYITPQILGGNTNPNSNSNVTAKNPNDDDVVVVTTVVVDEEKTSNTSTPVSADGVADRISRIDSEVFNRISSLGGGKGINKSNSVISRKPVGSGVGRMNSVMSRGSVYSVRTGSLSSVSNYSSAVQSPVEDVKLRKKDFFGKGGDDDDDMPKRYGVKKFVGQPTEDMLEVVIGETKYAVTKVKGMDDDDRPISGDWGSGSAFGSGSSPKKPGSRPATGGGELQEPESTVVFLGHGRGMSVGGVEVDFGPTADLGGKLGPKEKNVVRRKPAHDRNSSRDSDLSGVGKRRSVAWAPGMVNFNTNAGRNVDSNASEVGSLGATGTATTGNANVWKPLNTHKGKQREDEKEEEMELKEKKEEFDAHSYVGAHYELAQQTTDVMRNKLLNQHHQRSGSLGTGQFLSYFNVGRRKSKTPSDEGEQPAGSGNGGNATGAAGATGTANRPALHSRTNSVSAEQLRRISRAGSAADLLHGTGGGGSTGSDSPNLASRPQSRSANRELATTAPSRPQSQGNLLSRPASRGPSALMNTNNPSTSALPLHSLPPPMVSPIPPSSYHPPQVTPTASIYHPPPHLQSGPSTPSYGVTDHYSNYRQRERGDSGAPDGRLSAGEQEYIARSTGTPLLGQNWNSETSKIGKAPPHKAGLLGQMEKREKERKDFKERTNRNSWAVQHAMRQRQSIVGMGSLMQQQAQQEAQKQAQQQQLQAQQQQYQYQYQQQQQQQQQYQYQQYQQQQQLQLQQQTGMGVGFGNSGQHMGQPIQQHYGFYGHQQPQQQPQQQQQQNAATIAAWNAQQQQQLMIMQQQIALAQAQQQQMAERRGSWRYG